jgi:hypothetical protein
VRAAIRQACGIDIEADPTAPGTVPTPGPPTTATGAPATATGTSVPSPTPTGTIPTIAGGY